MKFRTGAMLVLAAMSAAACQKKPAPAIPAAPPTPAVNADSIAEWNRMQEAKRQAEEAERAQREALRQATNTLLDVVFFEYDSQELTAAAQSQLQEKIAILRANPEVQLRIEGHADDRGSAEYNLALAQRRAESVRDYLAHYGIPANRFATLSYGEEMPLIPGETEAEWARNRRAEFVLTAGAIKMLPAR